MPRLPFRSAIAAVSAAIVSAASPALPAVPRGGIPAAGSAAAASDYRSGTYLDRLHHSQEAIYAEVVRHYDSLLAHGADKAAIHVEKCKFIDAAFYDSEEEYNPKQEEWDACYDNLQRLYPDDARAAAYRLTRLYGDSAIAWGRLTLDRIARGRSRGADDRLLAEIHRRLGSAYAFKDSARQALAHYQSAERYGDTTDLRLEMARQWADIGEPARAREVLLRAGRPLPGWENNQAAELLARLGYARDAIGFYRKTIGDSAQADAAGMAKAMEQAGLIDSARVYQDRAQQRAYGKDQAARRRFEFDLRHSGGREALASYRAFREQGLRVDPFSFYRLRLFFRHPWLPVSARDLAGLCLLALAMGGLCLVPYLWVLPLHYAGNWWASLRKGPRESRFGMRHLWLMSAGLILAAFLAEGFFQHSQISDVFHLRVWGEGRDVPDAQNAAYLACFGALGFAFTAFFLRRARAFSVFRNQASAGQTLAYVAACLGSVYLVRRLNLAVFPEDPALLQRELLEGSLIGYLKSSLAAWGLWPTLLTVAVLVPCYEEVAFRGVLLEAAGKYLPFWMANGIQAAAFASLHEGWTRFPTYFAMGLLFAWAARRTGGLIVPMLAHAANNAIAVTTLWLVVRHMSR